MAIALGTIFGDVRLRLDSLRGDAESANGVFGGVKAKLQELAGAGETAGTGVAAGSEKAAAGLKEVAVAGSEAGTKTAEGMNKAADATAKAGTKAKESGFSFKSLAEHALGFLGGMLAFNVGISIFDRVAEGIHGMFEEASNGAKVQAQLNSVLKSTSSVSGETIGSLNEMANKLALLSGANREAIGSAQKVLLTFTNIRSPVFSDATEAALNLSYRLGTDLPTAAMQLGKALNDPIKGIGALRRAGVQLDADQTKLVKSYMAHNQIAKAQAIILGELQKEMGGAGEAAGKTLPGKLSILRQSFIEAAQKVGDFAQGGLGKILDMAIPLAKQLGEAIPAALDRAREFFGELQTKIQGVVSFFQSNKAAMEGLKSVLIGAGVAVMFLALTALPPLIASLGVVATEAWLAIAPFLAAAAPFIAIAAIVAGLVFAFKQAYEHIKPFHEWVDKLRDAAIKLWNQGLAGLQRGLAQIWPLIQQVGGILQEKLGHVITELTPYFQQATRALIDFGEQVGPKIGPAVRGLVDILQKVLPVLAPIPNFIITHWGPISSFLVTSLKMVQTIWGAVWPSLALMLRGVWNIIAGIVQTAWSVVSGIIKIGLDLLSGNWKGAWTDLQDMLKGVWAGIQTTLTGAMQLLVGNFTAGLNALLAPLAKIPGPVGDMARGALGAIKSLTAGASGETAKMASNVGENANKAKLAVITAAEDAHVKAWQHWKDLSDKLQSQINKTTDPVKKAALEQKKAVVDNALDAETKAVQSADRQRMHVADAMRKQTTEVKAHAQEQKTGVQQVWDNISSFFQTKTAEIGKTLSSWGDGIKKTIQGAFKWVQDTIRGAIQFVVGMFSWLYQHNYYFKALVDFIREQFKRAEDFVHHLVQVAHDKFEEAKAHVLAVWTTISNWVRDRIQDAHNKVVEIGTAIGKFLFQKWEEIKKAAQTAWDNVVKAVQNALAPARNAATNLGQGMVDAITGKATAMFNAGKAVIQNLIDGAKSMFGALGKTMSDAAGQITKFLGFHSPTEEGPGSDADKWTPNLMKMMAKGVKDNSRVLAKEANDAAKLLSGAFNVGSDINFKGSLGTDSLRSASSQSQTTNQFQVEVNVLVSADEADGNPRELGMTFGQYAGDGLAAALARNGYIRQ